MLHNSLKGAEELLRQTDERLFALLSRVQA
jgi:hypothetical protein